MAKNEEVFAGGGHDWHNNAQLMHEMSRIYGATHRWSIYAYGYKEAADRLVDGIDNGQGWQDFLVYPILYLYRHYLEVMIKGQIREAQELLKIERPSTAAEKKKRRIEAAEGHDIVALWEYLLTLMHQIYPTKDRSVLDQGTRIITAFTAIDAHGDAFRYPESIQGNATLSSIREINVRRLRDEVMLVADALTLIEGTLDYEHDMNEQERDYLGSISDQ